MLEVISNVVSRGHIQPTTRYLLICHKSPFENVQLFHSKGLWPSGFLSGSDAMMRSKSHQRSLKIPRQVEDTFLPNYGLC